MHCKNAIWITTGVVCDPALLLARIRGLSLFVNLHLFLSGWLSAHPSASHDRQPPISSSQSQMYFALDFTAMGKFRLEASNWASLIFLAFNICSYAASRS
jgi:hypothetical protein